MRIASGFSIAFFVVALPAAAQTRSFEARDTLLVDAAAVPQMGTVRGEVGAGSVASIDGADAVSSGTVAVLYSPLESVALAVSSTVETGNQQSPGASLRWQLARADGLGANIAAEVRYKSVGFTSERAEVEAGLNAGRRFGGFDFALNAVVGREASGGGTDGEGRFTCGYFPLEELRLGADVRYREELAEGEEKNAATVPAPLEPGRRFDLLAGPTIAWQAHAFSIQALAGVYAPKGSNSSGAAGLLLASLEF